MRTYFVGWDGGGTGTTVVCVRSDGTEAARRRFGPLNLNGADVETVRQTVTDALRWMDGNGDCLSLCIGAAGISNPKTASGLRELLCQNGYEGKLTLAGDHDIALRGAVGTVGAVVIAGTGSICCGRNTRGETARAGGGGHLIDDEGSGYAIGRDIFTAVLRALDGRIETTVLSDMVARELGDASREAIVGYVYQKGRSKADIAHFAPLLTPACEAGDEAALAIADKAAHELCALLLAVSRRLGMPDADAALLGSILEKCAPVREETKRRIREQMPRLRVIAPRADAAMGAALIAKEKWEEKSNA